MTEPTEPLELYRLPKQSDYKYLTGDGIVFDTANLEDALWQLGLEPEDIDAEPPSAPERSHASGPVDDERFESLRRRMEAVDADGLLMKLAVVPGGADRPERPGDYDRVAVLFSGRFDGETLPFTGPDTNKETKAALGDGSLLIGLEMAIKTMTVGETSKFLIHHSLMYGDIGCPPHIPPKADCLFRISLLSIKSVSNRTTDSEGELEKSLKKSFKLFNQGKAHVESKRFNDAARAFSKAVDTMRDCRLKNHHEEKQQVDMLCRLYPRLAECYNFLNYPKKACCMCNEYNKITKRSQKNPQILLQHARALVKLDDFDRAEEKLYAALTVDKDNKEIKCELELINETRLRLDQRQKLMSEIGNSANETSKEKIDIPEPDGVTDDFVIEIQNICMKILSNSSMTRYRYNLPKGLAKTEIDSIQLICLSYNLEVVQEEECNFIDIIKISEPPRVSDDFVVEIQDVCMKILNDSTLTRYRYSLPEGLTKSEIESIKLICISYNLEVSHEEGSDFIEIIKP